jgi:alpha-tubulin suppressor-like RCC1 family protein
VPAGSDFTGIAAGFWHNVAVKADGSLVAWGNNDFSQCNVPAGNDFAAVAAGLAHHLITGGARA